MPKPYKKEVQFGQFRTTSIVMDQADFDAICDEIEKNLLTGMTKEQVTAIREAKHVPVIGRGTKTEWLFQRFEVQTPIMSIMVRGQGKRVMASMPEEVKQTLWDAVPVGMKLRLLEAESTVMLDLLYENDTLVEMIKRGESKEACLAYINENW